MKNKTDNLNRIIYIILVIYYIKKEKYNPVNVINKDKKYLMFKGSNYDDEIRKINIYI